MNWVSSFILSIRCVPTYFDIASTNQYETEIYGGTLRSKMDYVCPIMTYDSAMALPWYMIGLLFQGIPGDTCHRGLKLDVTGP